MLASEGKSPAAEILASLGDTDAAVVAYARRAVDAVLAIEPQPHSSEYVVGTIGRTSVVQSFHTRPVQLSFITW